MTEQNRETAGIAVSAGALLALYAFQRSRARSGAGLGNAGTGTATLRLGVPGDPNGAKGPYQYMPPNNWMFLNVFGPGDKDWVETNWTQGVPGPDGRPTHPASVFDSYFPTSWTPSPSKEQAKARGTSASDIGNHLMTIGTQSQLGGRLPSRPGTYTLQIAVNGRVVISYPLVVAGEGPGGGAYGSSSWVVPPAVAGGNPDLAEAPVSVNAASATQPAAAAAPVPVASGRSSPAVQPGVQLQPVTAPVTALPGPPVTSTALVPVTSQPTPAGAPGGGSSAAQATVEMTPVSSGITGFLENKLFGVLPIWAALALGAGAVWYFTKGSE